MTDLLKAVELQRELVRRRAKGGSFIDFVKYVKRDYYPEWFHILIANKLEAFLKDPQKKCLGINMPPQHGKSELTTRLFEPYALGENPDLKIAICSYSSTLANSFNRDIQRYIDSNEYSDIYPNTKINSKNVVTTKSWLRNSEVFEIIDKKGSLRSIGVGGGLSGHPVDLGIIDDPIKDHMEANSETVREAIWNWYLSVFMARLHNNSKQILIMTRWHEDDLAGRLLNPKINPNYKDWEIVNLQAIKEKDGNKEDPRKVGEALYPKKHSLKKLLTLKKLDGVVFSCLYQQDTDIKGGKTIKRDWFQIADDYPRHLTKQLWIDGAYTKNKENDPNGFLVTVFDPSTRTLYLVDAVEEWLEITECLRKIKVLESKHNFNHDTRIRIEPKATGKTLKQLINDNSNMTAIDIKSYLVKESKLSKYQYSSSFIESAKIKLVKGHWNDDYIDQMVKQKPTHDEFRDLTGYACEYHFRGMHDMFTMGIGMDNLI